MYSLTISSKQDHSKSWGSGEIFTGASWVHSYWPAAKRLIDRGNEIHRQNARTHQKNKRGTDLLNFCYPDELRPEHRTRRRSCTTSGRHYSTWARVKTLHGLQNTQTILILNFPSRYDGKGNIPNQLSTVLTRLRRWHKWYRQNACYLRVTRCCFSFLPQLCLSNRTEQGA